jgi:hypothetical protein
LSTGVCLSLFRCPGQETSSTTAAAKSLAGLLGVSWRESGPGGFAPVYVNETLTLDFSDREQFEHYHVCFQVGDSEFDSIFRRIQAAGIKASGRVVGISMLLESSEKHGGDDSGDGVLAPDVGS